MVCVEISCGRTLDNNYLSLAVNENTGLMTCVENKLSGEVYTINGDQFAIKLRCKSLIKLVGKIEGRIQNERKSRP